MFFGILAPTFAPTLKACCLGGADGGSDIGRGADIHDLLYDDELVNVSGGRSGPLALKLRIAIARSMVLMLLRW